jgi:hypothetical protein
MKTLIISGLLILAANALNVYSQTNQSVQYSTEKFSVSYYNVPADYQNGTKGKPYLVEKGGFERVTFLNDSNVRFGNANGNLDLNIASIEKLTFKKKGSTGLWIAIGAVGGALAGSLLGYAIGATAESEGISGKLESGAAGVGVALLCVVGGAIIGGNSAPVSDEVYYLNNVPDKKKNELARIILTNRKEY